MRLHEIIAEAVIGSPNQKIKTDNLVNKTSESAQNAHSDVTSNKIQTSTKKQS